MDTHHVDGWVVRIVFDEDCLNVDQPVADPDTKVVVMPLLAPFGPALPNLVDLASGVEVAEHLLANGTRCPTFQVSLNLLAGRGFPGDVAVKGQC